MARIPKLCRHKGTGRGYVTDPFTHLEVYLGEYGTVECQRAYDRWVVKLLARRAEVSSGAPPGATLTVASLAVDYLAHAERYYRKHGKPTSEVGSIRQVLAALNALHGTTPVDEFRPAHLKAVRQALVDRGLARDHINKQIQRLRRVWKWGVEQELVRPETLVAMRAVADLAKGRTAAREEEPVEPVALDVVEATIKVASPQLAAMIRLQLQGSMRAEDVVIMRPCDVEMTASSCCYTPWTHKTEHHDRQRRLWLGPASREILTVLIAQAREPDAWLFPSQGRGRNRHYQGHITVSGYRQQIERVCAEHGIPHWFPLQLRHTALTLIRQRYGLEAAQVAGGHANANTTEIYAARDETLARRIAEEMG